MGVSLAGECGGRDRRSQSTGEANPFQYAGRENDGATGLYYNRARYYRPEWGRFISPDPIGFAGGINHYTYAGGDPVNWVDLDGSERRPVPREGPIPGTRRGHYRMDLEEQPYPDMHLYWDGARETVINHRGGWVKSVHRGRCTIPIPKGHRTPEVRRLVRNFLSRVKNIVAGMVAAAPWAYWQHQAEQAAIDGTQAVRQLKDRQDTSAVGDDRDLAEAVAATFVRHRNPSLADPY
jgi:RHS repeat-associated protein